MLTRSKLFLTVLAGVAPVLMAASARAAAIVNLTLTVNTTAKTWAAFETYSGTTASSGLGGLQFDVTGTGGITVSSSLNRLLTGTDDDLGSTGFTTLRSNGTNGSQIRGYQPNAYTINSFGDATNVYLGVGIQAETINVGDSGGSPTNRAITNPVQIATGAYTGTAGSLTVSSLTTLITLLPGTMPTATTGAGTSYATFSPDSVSGQTVAIGAIPEPTSLAVIGLGGVGLLRRKRTA